MIVFVSGVWGGLQTHFHSLRQPAYKSLGFDRCAIELPGCHPLTALHQTELFHCSRKIDEVMKGHNFFGPQTKHPNHLQW